MMQKFYLTCDCGGHFRAHNLKLHYASHKHRDFLKDCRKKVKLEKDKVQEEKKVEDKKEVVVKSPEEIITELKNSIRIHIQDFFDKNI